MKTLTQFLMNESYANSLNEATKNEGQCIWSVDNRGEWGEIHDCTFRANDLHQALSLLISNEPISDGITAYYPQVKQLLKADHDTPEERDRKAEQLWDIVNEYLDEAGEDWMIALFKWGDKIYMSSDMDVDDPNLTARKLERLIKREMGHEYDIDIKKDVWK